MFASKSCHLSHKACQTQSHIRSSLHTPAPRLQCMSPNRRLQAREKPARLPMISAIGNGGNNGPRLPPDGPGPNNSRGDPGDDSNGRIPAYMFALLPLATYLLHASSCYAEGVFGDDTRKDVQALKRLVREAFAELVSAKNRLTKLEAMPESDDEDPPEARDGVNIRGLNKSHGRGRGPKSRSKVHLGGHLDLAVHIPWTNVGSRGGVMQELASAGVRSGPLANFTMQKVFKEEGHTLLGKALLHADGSVRLMQAVYKLEVVPQLRVMLAALGGSLAAVAPKLNPFAETGLTRMTREGHDVEGVRHQGTGIGLCLAAANCSLTAASFVQGAADGSMSRVSCAQVGVSHPKYGACHVVATTRTLTWLMGDSLRESSSDTSSTDGVSATPLKYQGLLPPCNRRSLPVDSESELAVAASLKVHKSLAISGWAARSAEGNQSTQPWGVSLQSLPDASGQSLLVAVGVQPTSLQDVSAKNEQQVVLEISAKMPTSDGLALVPGMVLVHQGSKRSMTVSMQTLWRF